MYVVIRKTTNILKLRIYFISLHIIKQLLNIVAIEKCMFLFSLLDFKSLLYNPSNDIHNKNTYVPFAFTSMQRICRSSYPRNYTTCQFRASISSCLKLNLNYHNIIINMHSFFFNRKDTFNIWPRNMYLRPCIVSDTQVIFQLVNDKSSSNNLYLQNGKCL